MWAPGGLPGPAGWDRRRVGARLRAALAGLQELQGLRGAQQARVRGALAMQPGPAGARGPRAQELRLERALAALQEQLARLRRQDVGLKTHLDQLDQQINELQLDVCRSSGEALDSDSRPSSGFYELSDVGSCSLSTSCASVCSGRLSPSPGSLLPTRPAARPGAGDWRPRSADETTVPAWRPWPAREAGSPRGSTEDTVQPRGTFRPRPVSTGDLERILPADRPPRVLSETTPAPLCQRTDSPSHVPDPKYQRDLVARGGREVYAYPSPLHAVALQSPLFALPRDTPQLDSLSAPRKPLEGPRDASRGQAGPDLESGSPGAYIDRLLSLHLRGSPLRGFPGAPGLPGCEKPPQKAGGQRGAGGGQPEQLACTPGSRDSGGAAQSRAASRDRPGQPLLRPGSPPKAGPKPWGDRASGEDTPGPSPCARAPQPHSDSSPGTVSPPGSVGPQSPPLDPGRLVCPPCPSRPQPGHPEPQAARLGRGASDKGPRSGGPPAPPPERRRDTHAAPRLAPQWEASPRPALARAAPGRSCSESTLCPAPLLALPLARQESHPACSPAPCPREPAPLGPAARRKQRPWRSTVEISGRGCPSPSPGPPRPVARRAAGAWARPTLARQDAWARSESDPSGLAGGRASLLPSTIAETSEEDASDHTVNCFGDRESSSSDPEGPVPGRGCGVRRGEPAWPRGAGARPPLPPVPKLCRIKASRALKKKIRRFQPAALKVMTMV